MGATAFRTKVVLTAAMARGRTILPPFGAVPRSLGVGVTHIKRHRRTFGADDPERSYPSGKLAKPATTSGQSWTNRNIETPDDDDRCAFTTLGYRVQSQSFQLLFPDRS